MLQLNPTLPDRIRERAARFHQASVSEGFYLENAEGVDDGGDYCGKCAASTLTTKPASERWAKWHMGDCDHHDRQPECQECGRLLVGFLTDYGADEELDYREEHGFDFRKGRDCHDWCQIANQLIEGTDEWDRLMKLTEKK